ncbi:hypothetical protein AHF37_06134 [Paragonimus kellicotti]|nr:hypothetical protein AHF37_06134 [Paragonimus kellicotti]
MNVKASNTNTSEEEYQIIDASCFNIEAQDQGLEFHLNLPCPVCGSFQSNFICEKCINSGSFVHSRRPTSHKRLEQVTLEIKLLTESLLARLPPKSNDPIEELKVLITSLEEAHAYNVEQNRKKRERRDQIRKRMIHCHTNSITQKRTILEKDFAKHSLHIERLRARYFKELLQSHFVAKLSPDEDSVDQFSGAKLYLDKENVFVGPEPRLSSHTALTYSVPTIRAAIVFTDLWLPPTISQHLRLSGSFLASLPQRDNLGRVYSALLHAVHMLCANRGFHVRTVMELLGKPLPTNHSEFDPIPDEDSVDQFSGAKLYLDKENVFVGPEPRLSSHTALTYSVPTIRAAIVFTDLWLPPTISQHLRLSGSFLASLPQRDNLGRVYSALLHAVHMLCANRGFHVRTVMELLGKPLPTNHSEFDPIPDEDSVDQFSGAKLYLDKENVFVGPEPRLSSHTALTYSVPTIRAAIVFTDLWLPPTISQHLRLSGSFLASLPQRDNLGRVYSALLHAVHMLCANRGFHVRTVMELLGKPLPTNHSEFDPIVGLYCLSRYNRSRDFDAPCFYALDGFFGDVPPPIWDSQNVPKVVRLHLEHVELGEEVKEVDDQSSADGDESSTSDWSTSLQVVSASLTNPVTSLDPDKVSMTSNELDRWELITPQQDQVMEEKTAESRAAPCQSLKASHDTTTSY